jgi:hypothetical protein
MYLIKHLTAAFVAVQQTHGAPETLRLRSKIYNEGKDLVNAIAEGRRTREAALSIRLT